MQKRHTIISILFCLLTLALVAPAAGQSLDVPFEIGQGFVFKDYASPQHYSAYVQTSVDYATNNDRWKFRGIARTVFSNGLQDYYVGNAIGFKFLEPKTKAWNLQVQLHALFGTRDRKLFGGGVIAEYAPFFVTANVRQEYTNKELYFDGGIGVYPFK